VEFTRKKHRLDANEYLGEKWFFVTMCCEGRTPVFLKRETTEWIIAALKTETAKHRFIVEAFCVMPDHLHFLTFGMSPTSNLLALSKSFKQKTAYAYQQSHRTKLWQRKFYDHVLRPSDSSGRVAAYIWMNPVRKGLCKSFDDYPFSGSFTRPWKSSAEAEGWVPPWKKTKMPA
jgi:putative transposase